MGTDMWTLPEISHHGEAWHPIADMNQPMKAPRLYPLFALLGDSRNHSGRHAPVWQEPQTVTDADGDVHEIPGWWYKPDDGGHERLNPISEPRGIPEDATVIWKAFCTIWEMRGASLDITWITLDDIMNADWDQIVYSYGVLMEDVYLDLIERGITPEQHPLNAGGPGVRVVSEEEYAAGERGEQITCIDAKWVSGSMRELHGDFLQVFKAMAEGIPDHSRLRLMLLFES